MSRLWVIVPAAGIGSRMGREIPKQYLPLAGTTVIEQSLQRLAQIPNLQKIIVATSENDIWWSETSASIDAGIIAVKGGRERSDSVLSALTYLLNIGVNANDWVLVHDAARPCVRLDDIQRLVRECLSSGDGGILGMPVRDTMKLADRDLCIESTQPREHLWHAFTPQMFRLGALHDAINHAIECGYMITDEASAMEFTGIHPKLVEGQGDNLKITHPADLALAEYYLARRED